MVLKLYGWPLSTPSQTIAVILYEKQIPFEYINIDLTKREHKTPEYITKHPFGQVPIIDDDGFILYESRAIARYLEEKYPNQGIRLLPTNPQKRALVDQAIWVEALHIIRNAGPIIFETFSKKCFGVETDQKVVEDSKKNLFTKLDIYERILSKQKYIADNEITLADICHIPVLGGLVENANIQIFEGRPGVERWVKELLGRESWKEVKENICARLIV